jgi:hypothetical protein
MSNINRTPQNGSFSSIRNMIAEGFDPAGTITAGSDPAEIFAMIQAADADDRAGRDPETTYPLEITLADVNEYISERNQRA